MLKALVRLFQNPARNKLLASRSLLVKRQAGLGFDSLTGLVNPFFGVSLILPVEYLTEKNNRVRLPMTFTSPG
jgi:hypothetical protein